VVTIEETAELRLAQAHVVRLEARRANAEGAGEVTVRELVRAALRMRPDRLVVGEVRGGEALDMLQAMNTGHDGSLSTLHANSTVDALNRLETLVLFAGVGLPSPAIRAQIASAVDAVIHVGRAPGGGRCVRGVAEVALGRRGLEVRPVLEPAADGRGWSRREPSRPRRRPLAGAQGTDTP
jgi:pilus assembly protein CpaF